MNSMWANKKQTGFTIVELLIVIVVVGILAAIVIVAYNGLQKRAQLASLQSETHSNMTKLEIYQADYDTYPVSITDCPAPAATNICLIPASNESYSYKSNLVGGTSSMNNLISSYDLTILGSSQFLFTSSAEKTGYNEFTQYVDLAPIIDRYGLVKYQISFDIKSANIASKSTTQVYFQNGSGTRYGNLGVNVNVTTSYTHQVLTFTPTMSNSALTASILAFYGTYTTGNISTVKNLQVQLAP